MALGFSGLFSRDVGIDLGTVNTLIARRDYGIILREPSMVALDHDKRIIAVGKDAISMLGRAPGAVRIVNPLQEGVVADYRLCEAMLRHFLEKSLGNLVRRAGVRAVLCVPGCVTEVEKRALEEAARNAGARAAFLLDEPVAAAIGAGLPVEEAAGSVLALGGVVEKHSVRAGGTHINMAIMQYVRSTYGLSIGVRTAEEIKIALGSALPGSTKRMEVRGREISSGLPRTLTLTGMEVYRAILPQVLQIISCVREVLSVTPPELAGDIYDRGMCLTGGGALLNGLPELFVAETGIMAYVAERPLDCVVEGARIAVENIAYYRGRAV